MADIPNLAGVATSELVESIGGGNFKASYINWARTVNLLHEHAPGWQAELMRAPDEGILHRAPVGSFLLIRFRHTDGTTTPEVPQAVMDSRNAAIQYDKVTARDLTDTHRRGVCMAAAFTFGLAYELWAKVALESGYPTEEDEKPKPERSQQGQPLDGVWEALTPEDQGWFQAFAADLIQTNRSSGIVAVVDLIEKQDPPFSADDKAALWVCLKSESALRTAINKEIRQRKEQAP